MIEMPEQPPRPHQADEWSRSERKLTDMLTEYDRRGAALAEIQKIVRNGYDSSPATRTFELLHEISNALFSLEDEFDEYLQRRISRSPEPGDVTAVEAPAPAEPPDVPEALYTLDELISHVENAFDVCGIEVSVFELEPRRPSSDPLRRLTRCLRSHGVLDEGGSPEDEVNGDAPEVSEQWAVWSDNPLLGCPPENPMLLTGPDEALIPRTGLHRVRRTVTTSPWVEVPLDPTDDTEESC